MLTLGLLIDKGVDDGLLLISLWTLNGVLSAETGSAWALGVLSFKFRLEERGDLLVHPSLWLAVVIVF